MQFLSESFLHFVPYLHLAHSIYFGLITAYTGLLIELIPNRFRHPARLTLLVILTGYLCHWLFNFSILDWLGNQNFSIVVLFVSCFLTLLLLDYLANALTRNQTILTVIAIFLLKILIVQFIPTGYLLERNHFSYWRVPSSSFSLPVHRALYPLTRQLSQAIDDYRWLIPGVPDGKKIVLILFDATRDDFVGKKMNGRSVTPNLDELAERGMRFNRYYVQSSWTKPSTASLFTGRYPSDHGSLHATSLKKQKKYRGQVLPRKFDTLAERLGEKNFKSLGIVPNGHISGRYYFDQGFDHWLAPGSGYSSESLSIDQVLFWLLHEQPKRAFLYLHMIGPHQPFGLAYRNKKFLKDSQYFRDGSIRPVGRFRFTSTSLKNRIMEGQVELKPKEVRFLRHLYAAKLNMYDRMAIPLLKNNLEELNLFENALTIFTSDHGEALYDHENYAHDNDLFEEIINVPLIIHPPNGVNLDHVPKNDLLESIDLTVSLLEFANSPNDDLPGERFLSSFPKKKNRNDSSKNYAFSEQPGDTRIRKAAVIGKSSKLIHQYNPPDNSMYELRNGKDHLIDTGTPSKNFERLRSRLFDRLGSTGIVDNLAKFREATPSERNNLEALGYID